MTANSPSSKSNRQAEFESLSTSLVGHFMGEVSNRVRQGRLFAHALALTCRDSSCIVQIPVLGLWLHFWRHHCRGTPEASGELHYTFLWPESGWIEVALSLPTETMIVPSIVSEVHGADWHEREIEDMFGICCRITRGLATSSFTTRSGVKASRRCASVRHQPTPARTEDRP